MGGTPMPRGSVARSSLQSMTDISFQSPWLAAIGASLCVICACVAILRRVDLPTSAICLLFLASACFAAAAGEPRWNRPHEGVVNVLVDLSPSTRTADYRHRTNLDQRIAQLLGNTKYHLNFFADGIVTIDPDSSTLPDIPCEATVLPPLDGDAVVVFSDMRCAVPDAGPPAYAVIDPGLEQPTDALVTRLEIRGGEAAASLRNVGPPRALTITGANDPNPFFAPAGSYTVDRTLRADAARVTAQFSAGDAWPENDALSVVPVRPAVAQRWWVGAGGAGADWTIFTPDTLPVDAGAYLAPAIIVLDNIPAAQLDDVRQLRLRQYVSDLGGGLMIVGGNHAYAAGRYVGSTLENLSPLASVPPRPTMRWSLLVDGSGSMSEEQAGGTRWRAAVAAVVDVLPNLPPEDLVDVGSFAERLTWWVNGKTVKQTKEQTLPPSDAYPHGPTNLEPVLLQIADSADGTMPRQLLLISDADEQIDQPNALIELLRRKQIHLHVLAIGDGSGLATLRHIAAATGGAVVQRMDPRQWASGAAELLGTAMATNFEHTAISIQFENELAHLPPQSIDAWNRTWLKNDARELAGANANGLRVPLMATWNVGEGHVAAAAFDAGSAEVDALIKLVTQPPRDPRFTVNWQIGSALEVSVDAVDGKTYLNNQSVVLRLLPTNSDGAASDTVVPQVEPGRYELQLPAPRPPVFAELSANGNAIDRIAVAGRYAPEFDAIGNDHAAMQTLADRTGGDVITPAVKRPIDFRWPRRSQPVSSWFAACGALLTAAGLIRWRLR
jgi:hypothetical protein